MPFLSEEKLVEFHQKIDDLEKKRTYLDKLNDIYMSKNQKKTNHLKILYTLLILLSILSLVAFFLFYQNNSKTIALKERTIKKQADSIQRLKQIKPVKKTVALPPPIKTSNKITYGIQIGVYKNFDVTFTKSVQKIKVKDKYYYILGNFNTLKEAENFRTLLIDLKIKGSFVVQLQNGKIV